MADIGDLNRRLDAVLASEIEPATKRMLVRELEREIAAATAASERQSAPQASPEPEPAAPKRTRRGRKARVWDDDAELSAEAAAEREKAAAAAAELPPLPVTPLGHRGREYFFLSSSGQFREFTFRDLGSAGGLLNLFGGDIAYLSLRWPHTREHFDVRQASAELMQMCSAAGIWNDAPRRGYGVWREGERAVMHSGNLLSFSDGEVVPSGRVVDTSVFPAYATLTAPDIKAAATAELANELRQHFRLWRFAELADDPASAAVSADLLFGFTCLAMFGEAPSWRVHVLIQAVHGAGKSTLLEFMGASLGPMAVAMNNFTPAGLLSSLKDEARAALLDEAESDAGSSRMTAVIESIRQLSGGRGVQGARGTADGGVRRFQVAGCVILACINPPALLPQDNSRILRVELLLAVKENEAAMRRAIEWCAQNSAAFRGRMLLGWPRFKANLAALKSALFQLGANARQADQLASVLAASATMTDDVELSADDARHIAENVEPLLHELREEEADSSDAVRCFRRLLSARAKNWQGGDAQTIGSLLRKACDPTAGVTHRMHLSENYGLRIVRGASASMPEAPCVYVARDHHFLTEVFADTQWGGGGWTSSLRRLSGARASQNGIVYLGIGKTRSTAIPLDHLPRPYGQPSEGGDNEGGT